VRAVNDAVHSQKDSAEAYICSSSVQMITKHTMLLVGGFKLAPRPGIFTELDFHGTGVPLLGCELTSVPDPERRLTGCCCC